MQTNEYLYGCYLFISVYHSADEAEHLPGCMSLADVLGNMKYDQSRVYERLIGVCDSKKVLYEEFKECVVDFFGDYKHVLHCFSEANRLLRANGLAILSQHQVRGICRFLKNRYEKEFGLIGLEEGQDGKVTSPEAVPCSQSQLGDSSFDDSSDLEVTTSCESVGTSITLTPESHTPCGVLDTMTSTALNQRRGRKPKHLKVDEIVDTDQSKSEDGSVPPTDESVNFTFDEPRRFVNEKGEYQYVNCADPFHRKVYILSEAFIEAFDLHESGGVAKSLQMVADVLNKELEERISKGEDVGFERNKGLNYLKKCRSMCMSAIKFAKGYIKILDSSGNTSPEAFIRLLPKAVGRDYLGVSLFLHKATMSLEDQASYIEMIMQGLDSPQVERVKRVMEWTRVLNSQDTFTFTEAVKNTAMLTRLNSTNNYKAKDVRENYLNVVRWVEFCKRAVDVYHTFWRR